MRTLRSHFTLEALSDPARRALRRALVDLFVWFAPLLLVPALVALAHAH
jgi:hypothetical protein